MILLQILDSRIEDNLVDTTSPASVKASLKSAPLEGLASRYQEAEAVLVTAMNGTGPFKFSRILKGGSKMHTFSTMECQVVFL